MSPRWSWQFAALLFVQATFQGARCSVETQVRWTPGSVQAGPSVRIAGVVSNICWNAECAEAMNGYRLFFDFLNSIRGGVHINGTAHAVHFEVLDDGHSEGQYERAREATRILIQDRGFRLFLGPAHDASSSILEQEVAAASGVLVTPATAMNFTARAGPGIFSVGLPADSYLHSAMDLLKRVGAASVALLSTTDPVQQLACSGAETYARSLGMSVVRSEVLAGDAGLDKLQEVVLRLKAAQPDVLVGCTSRLAPEACFSVLGMLEKLDFEVKALVLTSCVGMDVWLTGAYRSGQYVLGVKPWTPRIGSRSGLLNLSVDVMISHWREIYNRDPSHMVATSMAAAEMLVTAIETSNSMDPQVVSAALQAMTTSTSVGNLAFDSRGLARREAYVIQYQQGRTDFIVAPPSAAERPVRYPKPSFSISYCYYESGVTLTTAYGLLNDTERGSVCVPCPDGWSAVAEGSFQVCRPCPSGTKAKRLLGRMDLNAFCEDCRPGRYSSPVGVTDCVDCPMGRFVDTSGATACRDCSPGFFARVRGMSNCISCREWSLQNLKNMSFYVSSSGSAECLECPVGGLCEPDSNGLYTAYTNVEGYFLLQSEAKGNGSAGPPDLHRCVHDGGDVCEPRGLCNVDPTTGEPASTGPFCGACREGYGRPLTLDACEWCGSMDQNFGVLLLNLCITSSLVATTFLSNVSTKTKFRGTRTVIIKQFISYIIMVSVAFQFTSHKYPFGFEMGSHLRDITSLTGMSGGGIVQKAAQCWTERLFPGVEFFKICTIFGSVLAPILVAVEFALFQLISAILCALGKRRLPWRQLVSLITITLFVLLPRITGLILMPMDCFTFDRPRLLSDTRVECDTDEHQMWKNVGYVGFFSNSIGIPLIMFMLLTFYKRRHELEERHVLNMLGFLYTGFESGCYYFECVNMMRNVLVELAIGVPFLPATTIEEAEMMACASLNILHGLFLVVHLIAQPYDNRAYFLLDRVETCSLTATWSTTILQTWLTIAQNSMRKDPSSSNSPLFSVIEEVLGTVVFLLHLRFWCTLAYAVLRDILPACNKKISKMQKKSRLSTKKTNCCRRKYRALFNPGKIEVTEHGFRLLALSDDGRSLFCQLFAELVDTLGEDGEFQWAGLIAAIQYLAINAYCARIKKRITSARPVHYFLEACKENVSGLPCIGGSLSRCIDRAEHRLSRITQKGVTEQYLDVEIDCLGKFTEVNLMNIIGRRFTVEEIHNAALRLGQQVKQDQLLSDSEVRKSMPGIVSRFMGSSFGGMIHTPSQQGVSQTTMDRLMTVDSERAAYAAQQNLAKKFSLAPSLIGQHSGTAEDLDPDSSEESSDSNLDAVIAKVRASASKHRQSADMDEVAADCAQASPEEASSSGLSAEHIPTTAGQSEGANSPNVNKDSPSSSPAEQHSSTRSTAVKNSSASHDSGPASASQDSGPAASSSGREPPSTGERRPSAEQEDSPVLQERRGSGEATAPSLAPPRRSPIMDDIIELEVTVPEETIGAQLLDGSLTPRVCSSPRMYMSDLSRLRDSTEDVYAFLEETFDDKELGPATKRSPATLPKSVDKPSGHAVLLVGASHGRLASAHL